MPQPLTRDLTVTVDAMAVTEAELLFQCDRLDRMTPSTENEREHLADLKVGYKTAARYLRILLNYHEGRLATRNARGSSRPPEPIDGAGSATAFVEDGP